MIVRKEAEGWLLYFHRAHALLSLKIANKINKEHWALPDYWVEGMTSIVSHDDGQHEWNAKNHLDKLGAPLDYRDESVDADLDMTQPSRVVNNAKYRSSFVALMISLHCHNLYKIRSDKQAVDYLQKQTQMRKNIVKHLSLKKKDVDACYQFLRWCDELSLMLCQNDVLTDNRKNEIGQLPKLGAISICKNEEETFVLTPWCFIEDSFELTVEYFETDKLIFKNDKELIENIDLSKPKHRSFLFAKQ